MGGFRELSVESRETGDRREGKWAWQNKKEVLTLRKLW